MKRNTKEADAQRRLETEWEHEKRRQDTELTLEQRQQLEAFASPKTVNRLGRVPERRTVALERSCWWCGGPLGDPWESDPDVRRCYECGEINREAGSR